MWAVVVPSFRYGHAEAVQSLHSGRFINHRSYWDSCNGICTGMWVWRGVGSFDGVKVKKMGDHAI